MNKDTEKTFATIRALSELENQINRLGKQDIIKDIVDVSKIREKIKELFTDLLVEKSGNGFEDVKVLVESSESEKTKAISISVGHDNYDLTPGNIDVMVKVIESVKSELESVSFKLNSSQITAYWMK